MSKISNCCGALPIGETCEDLGFCSECKEHAVFEEEEEKTMSRMILCDGDCGTVREEIEMNITPDCRYNLCKDCMFDFLAEQNKIEDHEESLRY